jgi:hypothetical protein
VTRTLHAAFCAAVIALAVIALIIIAMIDRLIPLGNIARLSTTTSCA